MDRIRITGGQRLDGVIPISGAKNAALPLMIASLLTDETLTLANVPRLSDVSALSRILSNHGVDRSIAGKRVGQTSETGQTFALTARQIVDTCAPYELVSTMRASFWVIAPILARMGEAKVSLPGGCAIGTRPVDLLLMALERLGAKIDIENGYALARAPKGLKGGDIVFPKVTVGGTHTALMAAVLADGVTTIENAAREPEVVDLADCLNKMGAKIEGAGTATITIRGVGRLGGTHHAVLPDRIETGTYAMAVAMTGGDVLLEGARADLLQAALDVMVEAGVEVSTSNEGIRIRRNGAALEPVDVTTDPFPGFPTDLQAQLMALMTRANGTSRIRETIFENRFMHVQELARLGAKIRLDGDAAYVDGVEKLTGAPVMATDLRASVSLVIGGLVAEGDTMINRVYHL
ncbi:MAG: UDP-N-acetylglucosamine 1-carboxyvinyltransferase, partial [Bosea sp.]|nr:UDP-N-acetylglucosamine 1-carboxyvinyltransferase [Bosea sp. (in: a-proteobacteria)]